MSAPPSPVQPVLTPRARLLKLLDEFEAAPGTQARCLPPGAGPGQGWDWLPESAQTSGTGLALLQYPDGRQAAVAPPFPVAGPAEGAALLRDLLARRYAIGIVLLRLGRYAVGVADREALLAPKTGHRYVKGRHRAGGQSQHRFEHNRENWIRELYDEACEVCQAQFSTFGRPLDWLALGGDRIVLAGFLKRCEALGELRYRILPWRVPVERPGMDALHAAVRAVWSSRVYVKRN